METHKIMYQDGKFYGLLNVPVSPIETSTSSLTVFNKEMDAYRTALESCKSNKLEIVNPEVIPNVPLWPGDIFDLPIGYEFKEEWHDPCIKAKDCLKPEDGWKCMSACKIGSMKVIRLIKTETKDLLSVLNKKADQLDSEHRARTTFTADQLQVKVGPQPEPEDKKDCKCTGPWDCKCDDILDEFYYGNQPEPEESQNEKEWERFWYKFGENDFDMRNAHKYYTIQRKKQ